MTWKLFQCQFTRVYPHFFFPREYSRECTCFPLPCRYPGFFPRKIWASFSIIPAASLPGQLSSICCGYVQAVRLRFLQHPGWAGNITATWKGKTLRLSVIYVQDASHFSFGALLSSRKTGWVPHDSSFLLALFFFMVVFNICWQMLLHSERQDMAWSH